MILFLLQPGTIQYADLQALSVDERREVYTKLPAEKKSQLWIEHLEHFLKEHELNLKQQEFLTDLISELENGLIHDMENRQTLSPERQKKIQLDKETAKTLFSREEARKIFGVLGPL
jgi:hypothetical protein